MNIAFPWRLDHRGRTAIADDDEHIRHLIELVLFTSPGERINRPEFGSGLKQLIFAPVSSELASATQIVVQGSLQQWLGELIDVESVDIETSESTVTIFVQYKVRRTQERRIAEVTDVV
ncbi:MAG TPA: GPW/gp25 family protein [Haliangium sp.]|nr:GPW/gp25 family protein [Haliangium sp.]